jgi:poly-gamma-glutamate synthesis protein (capsule biosynthesis protein)
MKIVLAGDTMLGRGVAEQLTVVSPTALFSDEVVSFAADADLFVLNLECCISERGARWPDPRKPFFFRAPPAAVEVLGYLGVDIVTLANNHALDYGRAALEDTFAHLETAGIGFCGAGGSLDEARRPLRFEGGTASVDVIGVADHPEVYAATETTSGIAYADLRSSTPAWLLDAARHSDAEVVLVTPHWGPNMTASPRAHVRRAAGELMNAGATLIAGHSAHVFHGIDGPILYDLGDFIDDYAVDGALRNDLGIIVKVSLENGAPQTVDVLPLKLDYAYTRPAAGEDRYWVARRLEDACSEFDRPVEDLGDLLRVDVTG